MKELINSSKKEYGPDYQNHLLAQYQSYCVSFDAAVNRRQDINRLFILLYTGIFSILGLLLQQTNNKMTHISLLLAVVIGFVVCYLHWKFLGMYKEVIGVKFDIITKMEDNLPVSLYSQESNQIDSKLKKGKTFSDTEKSIPLVFGSIYLIVFVLIIFQIFS